MLKHWSSRVKYEETVTDSRRLNLMNYFRSLVADEWSGGMVVGATTTNQVAYGLRHNWKLGRHNDRSRIESDDLHTLLGDHGFQDVWHPFIPVQIPDLTNNELGEKICQCTKNNSFFKMFSRSICIPKTSFTDEPSPKWHKFF